MKMVVRVMLDGERDLGIQNPSITIWSLLGGSHKMQAEQKLHVATRPVVS